MPIPWTPLTDAEWEVLAPFVTHASPRGRPCDLRARMDAIFWVACTEDPWRFLPEHMGRPDTVARYFRRLDDARVWDRLLEAIAFGGGSGPRELALRSMKARICRSCRRAHGLRRLRLVFLARRLGVWRALPAPPFLCPNPKLSVFLWRWPLWRRIPRDWPPRKRRDAQLREVRILLKLYRIADGLKSIPRALKEGWR